MPLSSGTIAVCGPTAGAKDLIASSRSNALQLSSTTSNFSLNLSACTVGGFFSVASPIGLLMTRPASASSAARRGRTRNVTSRPACSILPPKYPPMAPAPTTRMRIAEFLFVLVVCLIPARAQLLSSLEERRLRRVSKDEKRIMASWFETAQAPPHHEARHKTLPHFPEQANL